MAQPVLEAADAPVALRRSVFSSRSARIPPGHTSECYHAQPADPLVQSSNGSTPRNRPSPSSASSLRGTQKGTASTSAPRRLRRSMRSLSRARPSATSRTSRLVSEQSVVQERAKRTRGECARRLLPYVKGALALLPRRLRRSQPANIWQKYELTRLAPRRWARSSTRTCSRHRPFPSRNCRASTRRRRRRPASASSRAGSSSAASSSGGVARALSLCICLPDDFACSPGERR